MKATLTTSTFEIMYYETRGVYCNPAEKFLSYTEFKRMFEPALFGGCNINELATAIYNKAIDNGATEEAALHAALFVFSFTAGKQAARKWFDELVAKQPDDTQDNDNSSDGTQDNDNSESTEQPDDTQDNDNSSDGTQDNDNSESTPATPELAAAFNHAFVQTASFVSALNLLQLKKDSKLQAFVNEYRIDAVTAIKQLSKKSNDLNNAAAAKKLRILSKALIAAVKSDDINVLIPVINYVNTTNDDSITVIITVFELLNLSESESEEDPKDPDPTGPSDSGAVVSEPVEESTEENEPEEDPKDPDHKDPSDSGAAIDPMEGIFEPIEVLTVANDINPVNKKPIPDVEEACLFNGKEFSDSDLVTILKNKITVLEGRKVSRNSINMLLNLIMNNQDKFVTKLIDLGAKAPLEIKEVKVTKYTTDKKRFDTVFEVATNTDEPIVVFYHWDPILNEEGTAWVYDALVLPFDKVTLTKDAKKAKADKRQKTKKQTEQPAPQPQAMTATA